MGVVSTAGPAMNILGLFLAFTILQTAYSEPLHDVWCGKYTSRHIDVGFNETSTITSTEDTGRCKVVYDMAAAGANCTKMEFTCGRFFLPNKDPAKCRRGSKMFVKVDDIYHTIPYHPLPYHTIPYHTIPYHT